MSYGTINEAEESPLISGRYERSSSEDERLEINKSSNVWRGRTLRFAGAVLLALLSIFAYVSTGSTYGTTTNLAIELEKQRGNFRKSASLQRQNVIGSDGKVMRKGLCDVERYGFSASDVYTEHKKGTATSEGKIFQMFKTFADVEKKTYRSLPADNAILQERYTLFVQNALKIHKRNTGSAKYGLNKFADISEAEKSSILSFKASYKEEIMQNAKAMGVEFKQGKPEIFKGSDTSKDWTGTLSTTYIVDQGYCGGCWAISATAQMESDSIAAGISTIDDWFSSEYAIDCDMYDLGCVGGNPESAWFWYFKSGGAVYASDYGAGTVDIESAYKGDPDYTMDCREPSGDKVSIPTAFTTLKDEEDMKNYVLSTGPLSVCYAASTILEYTNGIVSDCPTDIEPDHCSTIVGYSEEGGIPHWIVRNSWGADWGESGYFRLAYGSNQCKITYLTNYVTVEAPH